MRTKEEMSRAVDAALADEDWCEIEDIVLEALRYLPHLAGDGDETWNANDVKDLCQEIGDKVNAKWGVRELKNIRLTVECSISEYAARFLDIFWSQHLGTQF